MREYRFDVVRVVCMTYIVVYFHLCGYVYLPGMANSFQPVSMALAHASLGLFTFVSGYLLGKKYSFGQQGNSDVWTFFKKRILRVIPLFVIASVALWLIGFNGGRATLNGLICISPFVDPKPLTMYYIPVILWCYLLTTIISRHNLRWRVLGCLIAFAVIVVARYLFPSIDNRFVFDVFFYFVGLISAVCFDWRFNTSYAAFIKTVAVLLFALLLFIAFHYSLLFSTSAQMGVGAIGVFAILFLCEGISKLVFGSRPEQRNAFQSYGVRLIGIISYASMACYMFHRFFYWVAEIVWNPTDTSIKWLYMAGFVFPVIIVLSYAIQKLYDGLMTKNH